MLKLTCTADDMRPLAEAAEFEPGVHKWDASDARNSWPNSTPRISSSTGSAREDVEYILSTFQGGRPT